MNHRDHGVYDQPVKHTVLLIVYIYVNPTVVLQTSALGLSACFKCALKTKACFIVLLSYSMKKIVINQNTDELDLR